jgi:hypothetical protein
VRNTLTELSDEKKSTPDEMKNNKENELEGKRLKR